MPTTRITITEYCRHHGAATPDFILSLSGAGLIHLLQDQESGDAIDEEELPTLERFTRLHYDLDINLPGIEAIHHLLARVGALQEELRALRNRPPLYSDDFEEGDWAG